MAGRLCGGRQLLEHPCHVRCQLGMVESAGDWDREAISVQDGHHPLLYIRILWRRDESQNAALTCSGIQRRLA